MKQTGVHKIAIILLSLAVGAGGWPAATNRKAAQSRTSRFAHLRAIPSSNENPGFARVKIMSCDQVIARARVTLVVGIVAVAVGFATVAAAQSTGGGLDNLLASPSFSIPQAPVGH